MNIQELIRESILRQIELTEEARKDRFILANENLSDIQKRILISIFDTNPTFERLIDWNLATKYEWEDFGKVFIKTATAELNKLTKNKDYIEVKNFSCSDSTFIGAYIPLNWTASQLIASSKVGRSRGQWCIAHSEYDNYWIQYRDGTGLASHWADSPSVFVMVVLLNTKFAVQVSEKYGIIIWDEYDDNKGDKNDFIPGVDLKTEINKIRSLIGDVREELDKMTPKFKIYSNNGDVAFAINGDSLIDHIFDEVNIDDLNFNEAELDGAKFILCNCDNSSFVKAKLNSITINDSHMNGCDFTDSYGELVNINETQFENAKFIRTSFTRSSKVAGCNFTGADLTEATFNAVNMPANEFYNSIVVDTKFYNVKMENTDISNSNFIRSYFATAKLNTSSINNSDFTDSVFQSASINRGDVIDCNFTKSYMSKGTFSNSSVYRNCNFTLAQFLGVDFGDSKFYGCNFNRANLANSNFNYCTFDGCDFTNTNLDGTNFLDAIITTCDFTTAINMNKAQLGKYAILANSKFSINGDKRVVVRGEFDLGEAVEKAQLNSMSFKKLPFEFARVYGDCLLWHCGLTTLEGSPIRVDGRFACVANNMDNLKGGPFVVTGDYDCSYNVLTSLEGLAEEIYGDFICVANEVEFTEEYVRSLSNITGKVIIGKDYE